MKKRKHHEDRTFPAASLTVTGWNWPTHPAIPKPGEQPGMGLPLQGAFWKHPEDDFQKPMVEY